MAVTMSESSGDNRNRIKSDDTITIIKIGIRGGLSIKPPSNQLLDRQGMTPRHQGPQLGKQLRNLLGGPVVTRKGIPQEGDVVVRRCQSTDNHRRSVGGMRIGSTETNPVPIGIETLISQGPTGKVRGINATGSNRGQHRDGQGLEDLEGGRRKRHGRRWHQVPSRHPHHRGRKVPKGVKERESMHLDTMHNHCWSTQYPLLRVTPAGQLSPLFHQTT